MHFKLFFFSRQSLYIFETITKNEKKEKENGGISFYQENCYNQDFQDNSDIEYTEMHCVKK